MADSHRPRFGQLANRARRPTMNQSMITDMQVLRRTTQFSLSLSFDKSMKLCPDQQNNRGELEFLTQWCSRSETHDLLLDESLQTIDDYSMHSERSITGTTKRLVLFVSLGDMCFLFHLSTAVFKKNPFVSCLALDHFIQQVFFFFFFY